MNKKHISKIVDELIEIEPTFAEHRDVLEQNIAAIVSAKPNTKFTQSFKKKLLSELRTHIAAAPSLHTSPLQNMQKFFYALGGAAVASFALFLTVIQPIAPTPEPADTNMERAMDGGAIPPALDMAKSTMDIRPQSGGGGGGLGMVESSVPYHYMGMEYVYNGDIVLPETDEVVALVRSPLDERQQTSLLENTFVDDMLDISSLKSLNVMNISLGETGDEPLVMNVDFKDGNISLNREIDFSRRPESSCRDQACWDRHRLKQSDMLSDSRTISIAQSFLEDLGVNLAQYGEPIVQDDWSARYESTPQKSSFYFPEQISVTFPYIIGGKPVYDESGRKNGVTVGVDMRLKAAMNVWGLRKMNLSEKTYKQVSDPEAVQKVIRTGGMGNYVPEDLDREKVELGDPSTAYLMKYLWNEDSGKGHEVYVPALVFPVTKLPEGSYEFRYAVVVPLAEELIQEQENGPYPMPLPLPVDPMTEPVEIEVMEEGQAG